MEKLSKKFSLKLALVIGLFFPILALASGGEGANAFATSIMWIVVILIAARLASLVEKLGQPSVLGELVVGVLLGNLGLVGLHFFEPLAHDSIIRFLAELGVVILLFQIGLESNISTMRKVGLKAFLVAMVGVVCPFILCAFIVGPWLLPDLTQNAYLFIGATLTATSVGITARVFKDLKKLQTSEAQIVLGAAVIDDVLGLVILAVVSALVTAGSISLGGVGIILGKAVGFLFGAVFIGQLAAPYLGRFLSKVHTGVGMKFTLALAFGLFGAFVASLVGLAPIVGAFAAGLVLDPVHFRYFKDAKVVRDIKELSQGFSADQKLELEKRLEKHSHRHIEDLIEPIALFLVPIFFVMTGFGVKLETLGNLPVLMVALGLTAAAFIGKILSGLAAGKGNDKWIVGFGMIPRGEVGLIFAVMGKSLGVVNDELFSAIVIMVILTTLATPPILNLLLKRQDQKLNR